MPRANCTLAVRPRLRGIPRSALRAPGAAPHLSPTLISSGRGESGDSGVWLTRRSSYLRQEKGRGTGRLREASILATEQRREQESEALPPPPPSLPYTHTH